MEEQYKNITEILSLAKKDFGTAFQSEMHASLDAKDLMELNRMYNDFAQLKEDYRRLSNEAQATAFDSRNPDTELLLRVLLKQKQITLENGMYQRQDFDYEPSITVIGQMKKKDKAFYITDDSLDEYTKQLEHQLKEYEQIKTILNKYNTTNETPYDLIINLDETCEKLKKRVQELENKQKGRKLWKKNK